MRAFLEHLAVERNVAPATQNQAINALIFLYRQVLDQPLGDIGEVTRARRLPVVLAHDEVMRVLKQMPVPMRLMGSLMHGGGLRVTEVCHLRVRGIDIDRESITVRSGKRNKDRVTLLPSPLVQTLRERTDIRTIQELMSHKSVETAQVYTRVLDSKLAGMRSPIARGAGASPVVIALRTG